MFPHYIPKNPFFADLLGKVFLIPGQFYIPLFIVNGILIFLISSHIFKKDYRFLPSIIYLLSPWSYYETIAHSFYIPLMCSVLIISYGLIHLETGNKWLGNTLFLIGAVISIYLSVTLSITIPLLIILLLTLKIVSLKKSKAIGISLLLLILPLIFLILRNPIGFKSSFNKDVQIFSDPGLLNTINHYQGAAEKTGFKFFARISENKYLFSSEYLVSKYINQLIPETLFTSQYRLLGFSFSPPIFLGFIIPFFYGLYKLLQKAGPRKIIFASTLLVLPSVLANDLVSLNRLILFSPVIIFVISFGLIYLLDSRKNKNAKFFLVLTILLILFQLIVTLIDIKTRETLRFESYFGKKYELIEP